MYSALFIWKPISASRHLMAIRRRTTTTHWKTTSSIVVAINLSAEHQWRKTEEKKTRFDSVSIIKFSASFTIDWFLSVWTLRLQHSHQSNIPSPVEIWIFISKKSAITTSTDNYKTDKNHLETETWRISLRQIYYILWHMHIQIMASNRSDLLTRDSPWPGKRTDTQIVWLIAIMVIFIWISKEKKAF